MRKLKDWLKDDMTYILWIPLGIVGVAFVAFLYFTATSRPTLELLVNQDMVGPR